MQVPLLPAVASFELLLWGSKTTQKCYQPPPPCPPQTKMQKYPKNVKLCAPKISALGVDPRSPLCKACAQLLSYEAEAEINGYPRYLETKQGPVPKVQGLPQPCTAWVDGGWMMTPVVEYRKPVGNLENGSR